MPATLCPPGSGGVRPEIGGARERPAALAPAAVARLGGRLAVALEGDHCRYWGASRPAQAAVSRRGGGAHPLAGGSPGELVRRPAVAGGLVGRLERDAEPLG